MKALKPLLAIVGSAACLAAFMAIPVRPEATSGPASAGKVGADPGGVKSGSPLKAKPGDQLAAFSGGCFWGTEDEFRQVPGVVATAVGFTGGHVANPTYEEVCSHTTGHAETCLVEFNPKVVTYAQLLNKFWEICDPTTVDRQGPDEGDNYRSAIWTYGSAEQAQALLSRDKQQKKETGKIVTTIQPAMPFYLAEDYHQQYDEKTGTHFCPIPRRGNGGGQ